MASLPPSALCPDCGAEFPRARRGRSRRRCERCNRRHQNARARAVPPGVTFSTRNAASLRAALAAEQARLTALQDAARLSERDIAWLTSRLALVEARTAAAATPPEPRDPAPRLRGPA